MERIITEDAEPKNKYGAGLHIDFTAEEVTEFLKKEGYQLIELTAKGKRRDIIGNDGGGGVELSDFYDTTISMVCAVKDKSELPSNLLWPNDYHFRPDYVFRQLMKDKLLKL